MGELYNPYPKLPKNIRQIGDRDQSIRLYLEDYVNTYLKRLYPKGGQDLRVGVLLGTSEEHDGVPYLFVDGAMEMEDVAENGEKVVMTDAAWKKVYQGMEDMFPKRVVLGWFLCGAPGSTLSPLNYWKQHGQYFPGKNQLMYLNSGLDGEEAVYVTSEDGFYKLRGYSIYYERNQMMQDYMIMRKDARRVESGSGDSVIRDFRKRMDENQSQVTARRGTIRVLGGVCSALAVAVLAGGVVMVNNYEKMKKMESVLASVLPAGVIDGAVDKTGKVTGSGDDLWVEEADGNVYPTVAHETMSGTYPSGEESSGENGVLQGIAGSSLGQNSGDGQNGEAGQSQGSGTGQESAGGNRTASLSQNTQIAASSSGQDAQSAASDSGQDTQSAASGSGQDAQSAASGSSQSSQSASGNASSALKVIDGKTFYKVQDGETLYGICLKVYGNGRMMDEICELNGLDDENKIISGQNLILP